MSLRVLLPLPLLVLLVVGLDGAVAGDPARRSFYIGLVVASAVVLTVVLTLSILADNRVFRALGRWGSR